MECVPVRGKEMIAFVCGSRVRGNLTREQCCCKDCGLPHTRLCDFPVSGGKTCDRKLCDRHAKRIGPEKDYCPWHYADHFNGRKKTAG